VSEGLRILMLGIRLWRALGVPRAGQGGAGLEHAEPSTWLARGRKEGSEATWSAVYAWECELPWPTLREPVISPRSAMKVKETTVL